VTLFEVIQNLDDFHVEDTICAEQPWVPSSTTVVAREPQTGHAPVQAEQLGLHYFLEVSTARELIEDWTHALRDKPTPQQVCDRVIRYAIDDA
jgi:hypothetical protein